MSIDIWRKCKGERHITLLNEWVWRMESQTVTATRKLVDTQDEQEILEELIASTKSNQELIHWQQLLYAPFRFPPLKYGSRFGKRSEASLWYGSLNLNATMSEIAFYRFNFLRASKANYGLVEVPLTAYCVQVKTKQGIKLNQTPFSRYKNLISSPISYDAAQTLGNVMRKANIQAFSYHSARDPEQAVNVGLFTPDALIHKIPDNKSFQTWKCIITESLVEFIRLSTAKTEYKSFPISLFLVNGRLPFPAF